MKTYIVQLESHDDVISARDKISWSKANRVLLVWPHRGKVLEREIDLLLLQRHARHIGIQLAIVSSDGEARARARGLGIPTFFHAEEAQQVAWRRERRRRRIIRRQEGRASAQSLRELRESFTPPNVSGGRLRLLAFSTAVLSLLILAMFFLPSAEVELIPSRTSQELVIPVWASPEIPAASLSGGIPAQVLSVVVEGRDEAAVTAKARVADTFALGQVQLTNMTDQAIIIPEGSILLTLSDPQVRFITVRQGSLLAGPGQQILMDIRAEAPGSAGNAAAGEIRAMEGSLGLSVAVDNPTAMSGGTDRFAFSPGEQDYRDLRQKLLTSLGTTAREEIVEQLEEGQRLLDNTLRVTEVIEENGDPDLGQPGDRLMLTLRVEFQAMAVREADLRQLAQLALDASQIKGDRPVPDSLTVSFASPPALEELAFDKESSQLLARWELRIGRMLTSALPVTDLVRSIQGRSINEARRILEAQTLLAEPARIRTIPSWWPLVPFLPFRIRMVLP